MRILPNRQFTRLRPWMLWRWLDIRPRNGSRYLTRLYVLSTPLLGEFVHWFDGPDPDPDLHDHPWDFVSIVLRGGYTERRQRFQADERGRFHLVEESVVRRRRWSIAFRRAEDVHSIIQVDPGTVTLVIAGPRRRKWGFWIPHYQGSGSWAGPYRFMPWRTYLGVGEDV